MQSSLTLYIHEFSEPWIWNYLERFSVFQWNCPERSIVCQRSNTLHSVWSSEPPKLFELSTERTGSCAHIFRVTALSSAKLHVIARVAPDRRGRRALWNIDGVAARLRSRSTCAFPAGAHARCLWIWTCDLPELFGWMHLSYWLPMFDSRMRSVDGYRLCNIVYRWVCMRAYLTCTRVSCIHKCLSEVV